MEKKKIIFSSILIFNIFFCSYISIFLIEKMNTCDNLYNKDLKKEPSIKLSSTTTKLIWKYSMSENVRSVAISSDGNYIAIGTNESDINLFDKSSSSPLWSFKANAYTVPSIAISSDGTYIVAGTGSIVELYHNIYLFEKSSSTPLWSNTTGSSIESVDISSDGNYIVAASHDRNLYLFNKSSSKPLWKYSDGQLRPTAISSDGNYIVTANNEVVYLFDKSSSIP